MYDLPTVSLLINFKIIKKGDSGLYTFSLTNKITGEITNEEYD
jgi:hypothetical protein